jgi:hypothetical protein
MRRASVLGFLLVLVALSTTAQSVAPQDFGTQDFNYTFLSAQSFSPTNSQTSYDASFDRGIFRTGGGGAFFVHEIILPPGALLESALAYVRDSSPTADIQVFICDTSRQTDTGLTPGNTCPGFGSTNGVPNDTVVLAPWNAPLPTITGSTEHNYFVAVALSALDNTNSFSGVRLKWKRVVSPPPLVATFTDVPANHIFFQFIEALVKSGVTTGCTASPPQYCPDSFVTRGQMAVFISRALGLHWAP